MHKLGVEILFNFCAICYLTFGDRCGIIFRPTRPERRYSQAGSVKRRYIRKFKESGGNSNQKTRAYSKPVSKPATRSYLFHPLGLLSFNFLMISGRYLVRDSAKPLPPSILSLPFLLSRGCNLSFMLLLYYTFFSLSSLSIWKIICIIPTKLHNFSCFKKLKSVGFITA